MISGGAGFMYSFDEDCRRAVEEAARPRTLQAGEYLCFEGDPATHLYIIRSGLIRVDRTTRDGRVVLLQLSGAGDVFGELGALDGTPRSASAMAIDQVELLSIAVPDLQRLYLSHPQVLLALTHRISARLRSLTDQLMQSGERSIDSRVAARLVAYIDRSEYATETEPFNLPMPISQAELGEWAGLSREGISKAMRSLRQQGVLTTGRQRLQVHRVDKLRAIAQEMG